MFVVLRSWGKKEFDWVSSFLQYQTPCCVSVSLSKLRETKRSVGEGNGNPLQFSYPENPVDRGAWWAIVLGIEKSRTRLSS